MRIVGLKGAGHTERQDLARTHDGALGPGGALGVNLELACRNRFGTRLEVEQRLVGQLFHHWRGESDGLVVLVGGFVG